MAEVIEFLPDGSARIRERPDIYIPVGGEHWDNLALSLDSTWLTKLGAELHALYEFDMRSVSKRADMIKKGYQELKPEFGARTDDNAPFDGATAAKHTLLQKSTVDFQSQAAMSLFPAPGPAQVRVLGSAEHEIQDAGRRVIDFVNFYLLNKCDDYKLKTERMLFTLALKGLAFKKIWWDSGQSRLRVEVYDEEDIILNASSKSLSSARRITHRYLMHSQDMQALMDAGTYRAVTFDRGGVSTQPASPIAQQREIAFGTSADVSEAAAQQKETSGTPTVDVMEMHVRMRVDADINDDPKDAKPEKPYIVTMLTESKQIVSIRRNWEEGNPQKAIRFFFDYHYLPGKAYHGRGLVETIGSLNKACTSLLRQMIDSGTLGLWPRYFGASTLNMNDAAINKLPPGRVQPVTPTQDELAKSLVKIDDGQANVVLLELLKFLSDSGLEFSAASAVQQIKVQPNSPAAPTLISVEDALKVVNAIQGRLHTSAQAELNHIYDLLKSNYRQDYPYPHKEPHSLPSDFQQSTVAIMPASNPNESTFSQTMLKIQAVFDVAAQYPGHIRIHELLRRFLMLLNMPNIDDLLPPEDDPKPADPITENQKILRGEPVRAFAYQDHEAHEQCHAINDMAIKALMEEEPDNKLLAQAKAANDAHRMEHRAFAMRVKTERQMDRPLAPEGAPMSEEEERAMSPVLAAALQKAADVEQQDAARKQAEEDAKDPHLQLKEREVQVKEDKQRLEEWKAKQDAQMAMIASRLEAISLQLEHQGKDQDRAAKAAEKVLDSETAIKTAQLSGKTALDVAKENAKGKPKKEDDK